MTVQLDMDQRHIKFLKNGVAQGVGDGLPGVFCVCVFVVVSVCVVCVCVCACVCMSLVNIMDSIALHSSTTFTLAKTYLLLFALFHRGSVALRVPRQHHGQHHPTQQQHVC